MFKILVVLIVFLSGAAWADSSKMGCMENLPYLERRIVEVYRSQEGNPNDRRDVYQCRDVTPDPHESGPEPQKSCRWEVKSFKIGQWREGGSMVFNNITTDAGGGFIPKGERVTEILKTHAKWEIEDIKIVYDDIPSSSFTVDYVEVWLKRKVCE